MLGKPTINLKTMAHCRLGTTVTRRLAETTTSWIAARHAPWRSGCRKSAMRNHMRNAMATYGRLSWQPRTAVQSANQRITTSVNVPHLLRLASMNGSTLQNNCHCARGTWRASAAPNSGSRKRLERHFLLKEMYCQFMSEYISLNHMQINVDISQPHYLIPPLSEVTQK